MHVTSCSKSELKPTCLTAKFGSFLDHAETGKNTKFDQFFCPIFEFFEFCNLCFFYHTFTNDADFVDKAYAEICDSLLMYIAVFLY